MSDIKRVKREDISKWKGPLICGPIPADCDAESWVQKTIAEKHPDTEAFCMKVYDEVKEYAEDEAQYPRIQGSYWLLRSK